MSEPEIKGSGPLDLVSDVDKKRLQKEKDLADREDSDVRFIMKSAAGRRFVKWILESASVHNGIFVAGDSGYSTSYNSGRQDLGLQVLKRILKADPELYTQMMVEDRAERIQIEKELHGV